MKNKIKKLNFVMSCLLFLPIISIANEKERLEVNLLKLEMVRKGVVTYATIFGSLLALRLLWTMSEFISEKAKTELTNALNIISVNKEEAENYILSPATEQLLKSIVQDYNSERSENPIFSCFLYGEPGTGKTTFANRLASDLQIENLVLISTSSMTSKYMGEGARLVKKTFGELKTVARKGPVIAVFDEVESYLFSRNSERGSDLNKGGGQVTEFLSQYDQVKNWSETEKGNIIFVFTTNHYEDVDQAVKDRVTPPARHICLELPDFTLRYQLIKNLLQPITEDKNLLEQIAFATAGFSSRKLNDFIESVVNHEDVKQQRGHALKKVIFNDPCLATVKKLKKLVKNLDNQEDIAQTDQKNINFENNKILLLHGNGKSKDEVEKIAREIAKQHKRLFLSFTQLCSSIEQLEGQEGKTRQQLIEKLFKTYGKPVMIFYDKDVNPQEEINGDESKKIQDLQSLLSGINNKHHNQGEKGKVKELQTLLNNVKNNNIAITLPCTEELKKSRLPGVSVIDC